MRITIELTDTEVEEFVKYMYYAHVCKTLAPDVLITDNVAVKVLREVAAQQHQKDQQKIEEKL